jgi:hypothetical protein
MMVNKTYCRLTLFRHCVAFKRHPHGLGVAAEISDNIQVLGVNVLTTLGAFCSESVK